jgi:uncharacterized Zn-binding protein involved in type VI secretion
VHIHILHIDECPNWVEAVARVNAALQALGRQGDEVTTELLSSSEQAASVPFAGSPTILLNGSDAFATEGRTTDLACRIYLTEAGFAGVPTVAQLTDAIAQHA